MNHFKIEDFYRNSKSMRKELIVRPEPLPLSAREYLKAMRQGTGDSSAQYLLQAIGRIEKEAVGIGLRAKAG